MIRSAEELIAIALSHGLRLNPDLVHTDESGADFLVAHAADEDGLEWVVRSPRRADVLEAAAIENRVLGLVRDHLPVAVPEWRIYTPEIIAYPKLAGTPAASIDPEATQYIWHIDQQSPSYRFIDSLAETLAALHTIDHNEVAASGIKMLRPDQARQLLAQRMDKTREILEISDSIWLRWQNWLADDTYWPEHSALVHGDLHPGHMLVDADNRLTGLLDWTESHVTDPATDFVLFYATLGEAALSALLKRYDEAGGRLWPRIREHIVESYAAYPVNIATFVLMSGEEAHLELARTMLALQEQ